jgi:membrane associated rhomboid family serine protease
VKGYQLDPRVFLGVKPDYLNNLQANNPWEVRYNAQLWRPFVSLFFTADFEQYVNSSFFLLLIGFMNQNTKIKFIPMFIFYLIAGFGGIMFGSSVNPIASLTVGCMPAIFGMLGG